MRGGRIEEVTLGTEGATYNRGDGSEPVAIIRHELNSDAIVAAMGAFTRAGWALEP